MSVLVPATHFITVGLPVGHVGRGDISDYLLVKWTRASTQKAGAAGAWAMVGLLNPFSPRLCPLSVATCPLSIRAISFLLARRLHHRQHLSRTPRGVGGSGGMLASRRRAEPGW